MLKERMTFADRVREAVQGYRGQEFSVHELADKMSLNQKQKKQAYNILHHMVTRDDEAVKVRPGVYRYTGRKRLPLEQVAWRLLRARKRMTVPDLVELAGMKASYARSWFKMLEKRGIVKMVGGGGHYNGADPKIWQLVRDTVEMPANTQMLEKHRILKAKRQKAIAKIDMAQKAIDDARELLNYGGEA